MSDGTAVFQYDAGNPEGKAAHADALELHLKLVAAMGAEGRDLLAAARKVDEPVTSAAARLRLIEIAREVFGLPPYDPETGLGVPAAACEEVLSSFLTFCSAAKKKPSESATNSVCSDPSAFENP